MERADLIRLFLKKNDLDRAIFEWLPSDASFRHYARIKTENKSYILMDAPPPEIPEQFALVDNILCESGLSAPKIYDTDFENGFILLEDFGDSTYSIMLNNGTPELSLYKTAVSALTEVAKIKNLRGIPPYDKDWLFEGLNVFLDWFIPKSAGIELTTRQKEDFYRIWDELFDSISSAQTGLVLNDFHLLNMMHLERSDYKSCGLLDFQDARVGPISYDLASLLEDARRDFLADEIKEELFDYYFQLNPDLNKEEFMRSYHIMAAKRHIRVIGVFVRLMARDGKNKYLQFIPHVWKMLEQKLDEPCLKDLKEWFDEVVPKEYRRIPEGLES